MNKGYRLLFIGLLLILIDLRINTFDLLPDFVGYIMIALGINELKTKGSSFSKATPFALILIFLVFPSLVGYEGIGLDTKSLPLLPYLLETVIGVFHLLMMYFIFAGTWQLANEYKDDIWEKATKVRWNLYAIVHIIFLSLFAFQFTIPTLKPLIVISLIIVIIVEFVMIVFIKKTESQTEIWECEET